MEETGGKVNRDKIKVIIGNGFDLNLGLPTAYSDFLTSDGFREISKENPIAKYFNSRSQKGKWVDIELALIQFSKNTTQFAAGQSEESTLMLYDSYRELCDTLSDYMMKLDEYPVDRQSQSYQLISSLQNFDLEIYDFNYTDSVRRITDEVFKGLDNRIVIHKVHGEAKSRNIIFGVQDSADIFGRHSFLKKSASPFHIRVDLKSVNRRSQNVIFFGHSLGSTDHSYFSSFFDNIVQEQVNHNIMVFYYGRKGFVDMTNELNNLMKGSMTMLVQNSRKFKRIDLEDDSSARSVMETLAGSQRF